MPSISVASHSDSYYRAKCQKKRHITFIFYEVATSLSALTVFPVFICFVCGSALEICFVNVVNAGVI